METQVLKRSKLKIALIIVVGVILAVYVCGSIYFSKRFYFRSYINGIDAAGKTVDQIEKQMEDDIASYTLSINGRDDMKDEITADEIELQYVSTGKVQDIKDSQNQWAWPKAIFNASNYEIESSIKYSEDMVNSCIDKSMFFDESRITDPQDAKIEWEGNGYSVKDEVYGNRLEREKVFDSITDCIMNFKTSLDLDDAGCYKNPVYTVSSSEVTDAKSLVDKYISSKITYIVNGQENTVDGDMIHDWITISDDFAVNLDENGPRTYMKKLANKYNTVGITRNFNATGGATIKVSGGDYGWAIDIQGETDNLVQAIQNGSTDSKEITYSQTAATHEGNDIGSTYVEINLSKQHLWFYKDGGLITEGDIVSGNVSANTPTPGGVYRLKYKQKDAKLVGEDYISPVDFWMPFNGGIGIHDASWRHGVFGKDIYLTQGSHGCINAPYDVAKNIYDNISAGTPIVCYYE